MIRTGRLEIPWASAPNGATAAAAASAASTRRRDEARTRVIGSSSSNWDPNDYKGRAPPGDPHAGPPDDPCVFQDFILCLRAVNKTIEDTFPGSDPEAIVVPEVKRVSR
jgi:hypothetical protein